MYKVKLYNNISEDGLRILRESQMDVSHEEVNPDAIVLRSHDLKSEALPDSVKAIGRAGVGVNNIAVDTCSEQNIVVFNSPGANANAVKELVLAGMLIAARNILPGLEFVNSINGNGDVASLVEKQKKEFTGYELMGKKMGVIGLGAIGVQVANSAANLGLEVTGYDPFISVDRAWGLSRSVQPETNIRSLLKNSDFISLHMPLTKGTRDFIHQDNLSMMKKGGVLLNFSRSEIVNQEAILEALSKEQIALYVTDFPTRELLSQDRALCIPHLGASTKEAEVNCAIMVAKQIKDYLMNGNIKNSVNFPDCYLERAGKYRLIIATDNIPNMVGQISSAIANHELNIVEMINKSRDQIAYNIIDLDGAEITGLKDEIQAIDGVKFTRLIQ